MMRLLIALAASQAVAAEPPRLYTHDERHQHHLASAGLNTDGSSAAPAPNCTSQGSAQGCLPAFPTTGKGIFFSGSFTDHTVLQRDASAAVYGVIVGGATGVTLALSGATTAGSPETTSGIAATVDTSTLEKFGCESTSHAIRAVVWDFDRLLVAADARWKASLPTHPAGGNFTIAATCTGCSGAKEASISDVTFGDVPTPK